MVHRYLGDKIITMVALVYQLVVYMLAIIIIVLELTITKE